MITNFLRLAIVSLSLLTVVTAPASAFTITFDEGGNCIGCTSVSYIHDPSGAFNGNVLIYGLPEVVTPGAVNILDPTGGVSDTLLFTLTTMTFYSYDNDGLLADVGTTVLFFPDAIVGATETADGRFTYSPIGNVYNGVSGLMTPLPGALPLFATGLGALGLLGWRRKRKQAA